jgi:hypothetical protein
MTYRNLILWKLAAALTIFMPACKKASDVTPGQTSSVTTPSTPSKPTTPPTHPITSYDYVIKTDESIVDASTLNLKAGAVVGIQGGTRGPLKLLNFQGAPGSPIIFINVGKVVIQGTPDNGYGITTRDCKYFKMTGTGSTSATYGIEVNGVHIGVSYDHFSSDFEVDHLEVHGTGFAGIMAKTDPQCGDDKTWRGNFTMSNVKFHDNYVHHTGSEGFYIGNSFYAGETKECGTLYPHDIVNLEVYDNYTAHTGAEGIQVGSAPTNCKVHDNKIENFGESPFANYQNNGLQIGGGTGGLCYNNIINTGAGNGLIMLGTGDNIAYNNIILNAAASGIFCDSRVTPGSNFQFINNTIINSGKYGVNLYSETIPMNTLINNVIINSSDVEFIHLRSDLVKLTATNNFTSNDVSQANFVNVSSGNYSPSANSPLNAKGVNMSRLGFSYDYFSKARGGSWSIGAIQ